MTQKNNKSSYLTYWKYVIISCLKRPYSYIGGICYLLFLAVVLLIIPTATHSDPMYIWASSQYNTTVFNLIFIAIACSGLVIAIFKKDQTDDTDLNLSAKPFSKWGITLTKLSVYIMFMLIIIGLAVAVSSLTFIFGTYGPNNITGLKPDHYKSLLLSILIGSLVIFIIFGSIAIFISLKGPIITTMLGTSGLALILAILNFIIGRFSPTPKTTLSNEFGLSINTYSLNTTSQYFDDEDASLLSFATIPSNPEKQFDTYEYWTKAMESSKTEILNYIDFGKQLSMLYETFGIDAAQIDSVLHNEIGLSVSYKYQIDKDSNLREESNITNKNYPISSYLIEQKQGRDIPSLKIVGHQLSRTLSQNWWFLSKKIGLDFNAINFPTIQEKEWMISPVLINKFSNKISYSMNELKNDDQQHEVCANLYIKALETYKETHDFQTSIIQAISSDESGTFFKKGEWNNLNILNKYKVISKIQLDWYTVAQQRQINNILEFKPTSSYPFTSNEIVEWYDANASEPTHSFYFEQKFIQNLFDVSIFVGNITSSTPLYSQISTESINCETFNNLYQYEAKQFFNVWSITAIYSSIAVLLFVISTIVYKRRDIK